MKGNKQVKINSEVLVRFQDGGKENYRLVNSYEADISAKKVSVDSLFGKAVLGQKPNTKIFYLNPLGKKIFCMILQIRHSSLSCGDKGISDFIRR